MTRFVRFDTIAAGGGHVATARAMRDAVERASGGSVRGEVRDAMLALGLEEQDRSHKRAWSRLLRAPRLIRAGQRAMDAVPRLIHALEARALDDLARRAARDLRERPADLVVVNHGFLMVAYTRARRRYGLETPVVTFSTEPFDANALWAEPRAERVIAPSHPARDHLTRLGVAATRIDLIGYPVADAVLRPPSRREARARLELQGGRWALLSLGGEGVVRRPEAWIDALLASSWNVMVVAGRNRALLDRLGRHPAAGTRVRLAGYVDDMPLRLAAVDLVLGKAGPASTLEAVAMGRPFLATTYAGLNERAVVRYLERSGLGARVAGPDALGPALARSGEMEARPRPDFRMMSERMGRHLCELSAGRAAPPPVGTRHDPWAPPCAGTGVA